FSFLCRHVSAVLWGFLLLPLFSLPIPAAKVSFADNTSTVRYGSWTLSRRSCGGPPHYLTRGTQACSRRSRSCKSSPPVLGWSWYLNFFESIQRKCSAWPSTKERLHPWLCLSVGKSK